MDSGRSWVGDPSARVEVEMSSIGCALSPIRANIGETSHRPVLVQFWHHLPPPEVKELMDTWRQASEEGFEYWNFDNETAREFIRENFDRRTEEAFQTCAVPAMKADFFRVCALLVRPGIYADADMRRTGALCRFRQPKEDAAPLRPLYLRLERGLLFQRQDRIANGFMIVKRARDPLLLAILAEAIGNIEKRARNNVYWTTGPGVAMKWFREFGRDHEYFSGFEFWTEEKLLPYMRMVANLPYKKTEDHWVNAQKTRSIFVEPHSAKR
jgi:mannosyltransferase OCH1-like enzyme